MQQKQAQIDLTHVSCNYVSKVKLGHEGIWGNGGIAQRFLNLGISWM